MLIVMCFDLQVNWDKELDEEAERQRKRKKEAKQQQQQQQNRKTVSDVAVPQLLPKPKGSTSPKPGRTQGDLNKPAKTATQDLLGLGECQGQILSYLFFSLCFVSQSLHLT
jgi:stromal membrane-associated protein